MARFGMKTDRYLGHYKARLFSELTGTVLEIGSGAGANLHYFPATGINWIGVDPNPFMKPHLLKEAHRLDLEIELRDGIAETLPAGDESVDFVISCNGPHFLDKYFAFLRWWAALKMKESQCPERVRVTRPA